MKLYTFFQRTIKDRLYYLAVHSAVFFSSPSNKRQLDDTSYDDDVLCFGHFSPFAFNSTPLAGACWVNTHLQFSVRGNTLTLVLGCCLPFHKYAQVKKLGKIRGCRSVTYFCSFIFIFLIFHLFFISRPSY